MNQNLFIHSKRSTDGMELYNFKFSERSRKGQLCLLLETITGYTRILDWKKDQEIIQECLSKGFVIAETRMYLSILPRSESRARIYLKKHLRKLKKDLEWIDSCEAFEKAQTGSSPDFIKLYQKGSELASRHAYNWFSQFAMLARDGD